MINILVPEKVNLKKRGHFMEKPRQCLKIGVSWFKDLKIGGSCFKDLCVYVQIGIILNFIIE